VLPIPPPLVPYLEARAEDDGPLLFPDAAGRQRKPTSKPEVVLRRALKRAGLVTGYRHTCRRCAALGRCRTSSCTRMRELRRCPVQRDGEDLRSEALGDRDPAQHEVPRAPPLDRDPAPADGRADGGGAADPPPREDQAHGRPLRPPRHLRHARGDGPDAGRRAGRPGAAVRKAAISLPPLPTAPPGKEKPRTRRRVPSESGALEWSGTPGSNRRPSPWQGVAPPAPAGARSLKVVHSGHDPETSAAGEGPTGTPTITEFPTKPLPH
jgi:hypothetical protein